MTDVMTKRQLIDALRTSGEKVASTLATVSDEDLAHGRYESGWNGRQIIAHMASIEWTYPRLIDLARGTPPEKPASAAAPSTPTRPAPTAAGQPGMASGSPQILSYNDRQVEKRADVPVPDLIAEFKKNRAATIAAVEAADDALLSKEITSTGGANGPLATVFNFVAVLHVLDHLADITGEKK
jgi:mycothiol maleylpyruvate isomerase-like protein